MFDENSNQKNTDNRGGDKKQPPGMKFSPLTLVTWIAIMGVIVGLFYVNNTMKKPAAQLSQAQFLQKFYSNEIAQATISFDQQKVLWQITGTYYPSAFQTNSSGATVLTMDTKKPEAFITPNA